MSAPEDNIEEAPEVKRQRLSSPTPAPADTATVVSSSWVPSVSGEVESCDSGLSDSGVTTPPVADQTPEQPGHSGAEQQHGDHSDNDDDDSLSGLSDMSGHEWKPDMSSKLSWLHAAMRRGEDPREILVGLLPNGSEIPQSLDNMTMWKILFNLLSEPPRRDKLDNVNTLDDCVELIKRSSNIIVLTGAGVSVSCGIPDFRSRDGVYARLAVDFPDLPDPQAMFDIHYFKKDPRPFFKFAREIYPGQFRPSPCHQFIKCIESCGKLLRNYTQNIDTLEQVAGIQNVIQCHGSFATASCMVCQRKVDAESIREDIFNQTIPKCGQCPEPATDNTVDHGGPDQDHGGASISDIVSPAPVQLPVMKPDIVFFGEGLPDHFHTNIAKDKSECDLLIVIGSSLKVRPVALIPSSLPPSVPQILINREPLPHLSFDVELLGDCDKIVNQICLMLGGEEWMEPVRGENLTQHTGLPESLTSSKQPTTDGAGGDDIAADDEGGNDSMEGKDRSLKENNTPSSSSAEDGSDDKTKAETDASHPADESEDNDVNDDQDDWKMKSLSDHIPAGQYLYLAPSRYVFPGAEVYPDSSDEDDDEDDDGLEEEQEEKEDDNVREEDETKELPGQHKENQND